MNNIQELRKIIADSKEGQNEVYILDGVPYYSTTRTSPYRSLADIRTIIEQAEENQDLKARIAELELWIECVIKPDMQIPEWVRVSATILLRRSDA